MHDWSLAEHGVKRWDAAISPALLAQLLTSWRSVARGPGREASGNGWHAYRHERQRRRHDWELLDFTVILRVLDDVVRVVGPALRAVCDFERLVTTHAGIFEPAPGCSDQKVHRDGLPGGAGYAWSVFLPMVPVRDDNGPTEYFLGSHEDCSMTVPALLFHSPIFSISELGTGLRRRILAPHRWLGDAAASAAQLAAGFIEDGRVDWSDLRYRAKSYVPSQVFMLGTARSRVRAAPLEPGTMILHDYRCFHRGTANRSSSARPMLYVNFADQDYDDSRNYAPRPHRVSRSSLERASPEVRHLLRKLEVVDSAEAGALRSVAGSNQSTQRQLSQQGDMP